MSESPVNESPIGDVRVDRKRHTRWRRWSIAGLLLLMTCAAGYLTGFRFGLSDGVESQVEARIQERESLVYVMSYRLGTQQLSDAGVTAESLAEEIKHHVSGEQWSWRGGKATLAVAPGMLIVSAPRSLHERVRAYMDGRFHSREPPKQNRN